MPPNDITPTAWCALDFVAQRELLARELAAQLSEGTDIREVTVEAGPPGRQYDLTAAVETGAGRLRTLLWSHARATLFCDGSVHESNRVVHGPSDAVAEAAARLRRRLAVPYKLESRGLTFTLSPEEGVTRSWTAEHSLFKKRTAVTREDEVERAGELDVRDLLAHFYTGPSLRLVADDGSAFLLPAATEAEGPLVTLCHACRIWSDGSHPTCPECGSGAVDLVVAARPPST